MSSLDTRPIATRPYPIPRAAYLHVPFCAHRCGYCDFTLISGRDDLIGDYLRSLRTEMSRTLAGDVPTLDTLFFGGGTPTHPSPEQLKQLFEIVLEKFSLADSAEFTVEANPLDLNDDRIRVLAEAGVNRISLGVQSFSHHALDLLERSHQPDDIVEVMRRLPKSIPNISFDLIFGVPSLSIEEWRDTLKRAIDFGPTHLSTYGLTFEKGTSFWNRREKGDLAAIDEELEREQYAIAIELLSSAGYQQYEISNFAKPGFESRHNNVYWSGDSYWGFGPGAASYTNGCRQTNIRSVLGWLARLERDESAVAESEQLDDQHRARELIYLGMRRNSGINRTVFLEKTGYQLDQLCGEQIQQQIQLQALEDDGLNIRLTSQGRFIADRVIMEFL